VHAQSFTEPESIASTIPFVPSMARTTLDTISVAVPDPRMLNESLNSLTFHDSPPPTLSSRMAEVAERIGMNSQQEGDDTSRESPPVERDPEGAITTVSITSRGHACSHGLIPSL
jgi:hypothetical protein